jgi:uncharacterized membrane protein
LRLWDYHFIYATALGVTKKYLQNLRRLVKLYPQDFTVPAGFYGFDFAIDSFDSAFDFDNLWTPETNLSNLEDGLSFDTDFGGGFGGDVFGNASGWDGGSGAE